MTITRIISFILWLPCVALAQSAPLNKAVTLVSVLPGNPVVTESESLCSVSLGSLQGIKIRLVPGLADKSCVSLELTDYPGYYLRHQNSQIKIHPLPEHDDLFATDATFKLIKNANGSYSFRSLNYPDQSIAVTRSNALFIRACPGRELFLKGVKNTALLPSRHPNI
jgi:hypothetical protein